MAALFAALAAAASSAERSGTAPASVGTAPTFVVTGHGWGHGVGMSQWGAYGYAKRGVPYSRILTHYYTGTVISRAPASSVRVLIEQARPAVVISSATAFRVRDGAGVVHALDPGNVRLGPSLSLRLKGAKKAAPLPGPLTFLPGGSSLSAERPYRGSIEVIANGKKLDVVNVVGLEAYLYGVVPQEVPDDWPAEALKAQAVAARTYALVTRSPGTEFDLYADTRSQVYGGREAESPTTTAAVDATAGQVVTYKGRLATTYFFSSSGGRTASIQDVWSSKPVPYLVSVDDPYDVVSPHHSWGPFVFAADPLRRKLHLPAGVVDVRTIVNASRRVTSIAVVTPVGELTVPGSDVRTFLDLRSTWFRIGVLSIARPAGAVPAAGTSVRLTGLARGIARPTLQQQVGQTGWVTVSKLSVAPDGSFSAVVKPAATAIYRVGNATAASGPLRVPVAPRVRAPVR